jgi:hypothetical protein
MNHELNVNELDAVSGGGIWETVERVAHELTVGSGSGSGSGGGSSGGFGPSSVWCPGPCLGRPA